MRPTRQRLSQPPPTPGWDDLSARILLGRLARCQPRQLDVPVAKRVVGRERVRVLHLESQRLEVVYVELQQRFVPLRVEVVVNDLRLRALSGRRDDLDESHPARRWDLSSL